MIRDTLLAAGLLFAVFTSLRFGGLPIGIGELCLAGWLALSLAHVASRPDAALTGSFRRLLQFWLLLAASLCLGTIAAVVIGEVNSRALFIHDTIAYALVAAISLFAVFDHDCAQRLRRVAWLLVMLGNGALIVQLGQAFSVIPALGPEVWFYNRFTGWTTNANQMGMLCLILVMLAVHLAQTSAHGPRLLAIACSLLPLVTGLMTRSDSFVLAIAFSVVCCFGLAYTRALAGGPGTSVLATMTVNAIPILALAALPLAIVVAAPLLEPGRAVAGEDSLQRDIGYRTELWSQALDRILASGLLGLGPGPHLVRSASLREPRWEALPDFEAHNTVIDLCLQGGLLAVAALGWLAWKTVRDALSAGLVFVALLMIGLATFAQTHFIARHPLIWFAIAFALAASEQARTARTPGGSAPSGHR